MPSSEPKPTGSTVFVLGSGFSAGLGFPTAETLLCQLYPRLPKAPRQMLVTLIEERHRDFSSNDGLTYPTMEDVLADLMTRERQASVEGALPSRFTHQELRNLRHQILSEISRWFFEIQRRVIESPPEWLQLFCAWVRRHRPTLISFNWDLVLDHLLYDGHLGPQSYGVSLSCDVPALLKPHGSLNWFELNGAAPYPPDHALFRLGARQDGDIIVCRDLGLASKLHRCYLPAILPAPYLSRMGCSPFVEVDRAASSGSVGQAS